MIIIIEFYFYRLFITHPVVGVVFVFDEDVLVVMLLVVVSIVGKVDEEVDPGNCVDDELIVVLVLVIVLVLVDVVGGGQVQR